MENLTLAIRNMKTGEIAPVTLIRLAQDTLASVIDHIKAHPEQWNTDTRNAAIGTLTQAYIDAGKLEWSSLAR